MPALRKAATCLGVTMLSLPFLVHSSFASPRNYDEGRWSQSGEVMKGKIINIEGEELTLRTSDGERIRFQISEDTNMMCRSKNQSSSSSSNSTSESGSSSSMSQGHSSQQGSSSHSGVSQGQQSQRAGYRFGDCNFQTGDRIKVRLDQTGNAKFVRYVRSKNDNRSGVRSRSVDLDFPSEYSILPAGALGNLNSENREKSFSVKSKQGKELGNIIKVVNNSEGDPAYAIIRKKNRQMISVPWDALETSSDGKTATLDVTDDQFSHLPLIHEGESTVANVRKNWDLEDDGEPSLRERFYGGPDRYVDSDRDRKRTRFNRRHSDRDDDRFSRSDQRRLSQRDRDRYMDDERSARRSGRRAYSSQSRERDQIDDYDYRPSRYR